MVPLLEVRQVKPSLLLRQETTGRRRDWFQIAATVVVGGRARGAGVVAGGVGASGPERVRRIHRADARASRRRLAADAADAAARALDAGFRCGRRCCIWAGPAIRRASFC